MIPPHKLAKLPRSQMLRKAAKLIGEAEHRFLVSGKLEAPEVEYLDTIMSAVLEGADFSGLAADALEAVRSDFAAARAGGPIAEIRRALNSFYRLLLAETGRYPADWDFIESSGSLDPAARRPFPGMRVYLEDIRSPFNVGSMFRAAESFGVEKVWLSPLCADPRHKRAERTAMGCVNILPWERLLRDPFTGGAFSEREETGKQAGSFMEGPFFALETGGTLLEDFSFPARGILVAGSEELGVSPRALAAADASLGRVSIPAWGAKGSLNVSVAFGIVMHAWAARLASDKSA